MLSPTSSSACAGKMLSELCQDATQRQEWGLWEVFLDTDQIEPPARGEHARHLGHETVNYLTAILPTGPRHGYPAALHLLQLSQKGGVEHD